MFVLMEGQVLSSQFAHRPYAKDSLFQAIPELLSSSCKLLHYQMNSFLVSPWIELLIPLFEWTRKLFEFLLERCFA